MTDLITPGQERYLAKQRARAVAAGRGEKPKGFTETANQRLARMQKEAEAEKVRKLADEALQKANTFAATLREKEAVAAAASAEREAQSKASNEYMISKTILSTPPRSQTIVQRAIEQQQKEQQQVQEQVSRTPGARQIVSNAVAKKQEFEKQKIREMSSIKESTYKDVFKEPTDYIPIVAATNYASVLSDKFSQQATKYEGVEGGKAAAYGTAAFVTAIPGAIVYPLRDVAKTAFTPNPQTNPLVTQTTNVYKEIKSTGGLPSVGEYVRQNPQRASADIATGIVFGAAATKVVKKLPVTDPVKSVSFGRVETIQAETRAGVVDVTNTEIAVETAGRKQYIIDLQTKGKTLPDFGTATKAPEGIAVIQDVDNPLKKGFLRQEESVATIQRVDSQQKVYELLFDLPGAKKPKVLSEKELLVSSQARIVETSKGQKIRGTTSVFADNAETPSSFAASTKTNPRTGVSTTRQVTTQGKEVTTLTAKNYPVAELEAPLSIKLNEQSIKPLSTENIPIIKFDDKSFTRYGEVPNSLGYIDQDRPGVIYVDETLSKKEYLDVAAHEFGHAQSYKIDLITPEKVKSSPLYSDVGIVEFEKLQQKKLVRTNDAYYAGGYSIEQVPAEKIADVFKVYNRNPQQLKSLAPTLFNYIEGKNAEQKIITYVPSEPVPQTLSYGSFTSIQRKPSLSKFSNLLGEGKAEVDIIRTERGVLLDTRTGNPKSPEIKTGGGSVLQTKSSTLSLPSTQAVQAAVQNIETVSSLERQKTIASTVKVTGTSAKTLSVNSIKQTTKPVLITQNVQETNKQQVPRTLPGIIQTPTNRLTPITQQVPRTVPTSNQSPERIAVPSVEQIPKSLPNTIQTPKQNLITETQQVPRTIQVPRSSYKTKTTSTTITPTIEIPVAATTKKGKKKRGVLGFDVFVKTKGEFLKANPLSLSEEQAFNLGASRVAKTSSASFKVVPSGTEAIGRFDLKVDKDQFRQSKRTPGVVVEKSRYRINTPGELREITFKGIATKRRGLL